MLELVKCPGIDPEIKEFTTNVGKHLHVGQRVCLSFDESATGEIIGFGPAMHRGKTVFTVLDGPEGQRGNHGTHHECGDFFVRPV